MKRRDVVRVHLPKPQGTPGREQFGPRPAIVVQADSANLSTVIIVPLTTKLSGLHFDGSFLVDPDTRNGLSEQSVVLTHQVRAIYKSRIISVIGKLSTEDFEKLETELRGLLGL